MINSEQTLQEVDSLSWQDKISRQIMLKIFASLPEGEMVIKENGVF